MSSYEYTVDKHNRYEYNTQVVFREIFRSIEDAKVRSDQFNMRVMKQLRRDWGADFRRDGYRVSDFARLAELLPADGSFDEARGLLTDRDELTNVLAKGRSEYDLAIETGLQPVLLLDPLLQDKEGMNRVSSFHTYTIQDDLRTLDGSESRTMYSINGKVVHRSDVGLPHNPNAYIPRHLEAHQALIRNNWQPVVLESAVVPTPEPNVSVEPSVSRTSERSTQDIGTSDKIEFVGWSGTPSQRFGVDEYELPGLGSVLGAYFTESDQAILRKHFDNNGSPIEIKEKHIDFLENSVAVLQYLRSNGIDFDVNDFYAEGQIDVRLSGMNASLRVFDLDEASPGQYIGRYYNSKGYAHVASNSVGPQGQAIYQAYTPEESLLPVKYMLGHIDGEFEKTASTPNSRVRNVEGLDGHIYIDRMPNRYDSVQFRNEAEAIEYLEFVIDGVDQYYTSEFNLEQMSLIAQNRELFTEDELESTYSFDERIREKQVAFIDDYSAVVDMVELGFTDDLGSVIQSFDVTDDMDFSEIGSTPDDVIMFLNNQIKSDMVGTLADGFNASYVMENAPQHDVRTHSRNAIKAALKVVDYDYSKLKGNDFATKNLKDSLIEFDPETARTIDDVDDIFLQNAMREVQDKLDEIGVIGADKVNPPEVRIDDQGIIHWEGHRSIAKRGRKPPAVAEDLPNGKRIEKKMISGEIGQVVSPNEHGIIRTPFASGDNYGFVPGYTGYFQFDGEYGDDRMDRLRVKGFEQHLHERIDALVIDQVSRPLKASWDNIPDEFDSSALNRLYYGDVYGRRLELDFVEKSKLDPELTAGIISSLAGRVRFGNEYGMYATTNAESQAKWDTEHNDQGAFSFWKVSGETNMRVLSDDLENIFDMTMTGNARTQGLSLYLVDGAKVNPDGVIQKSDGILQLDGSIAPDRSAIMKSDLFEFSKYNAWDRVQMSANQVMTAEHVDRNVGTALMTFGGWNYEDSFVVSKAFAERNQVQGDHPIHESKVRLNSLVKEMIRNPENSSKEAILAGTGMNWSDDVLNEGIDLFKTVLKLRDHADESLLSEAKNDYIHFLDAHGTFRALKRGDKLSDFGGNKGTIGIVIDPDMTPEDARTLDLEREVAIFKANPKLDVVGAPYSPLSRFNAGITRELQSGEVLDVIDPLGNNGEGKVLEGALGELNFIITDLTVDDKSKAYTDEDVAEGGGRKASGQLAWALQSHGALDILTDIYGYNDSSWAALREYMIVTGLDMGPDGTLKVGYEPHSVNEVRNILKHSDFETSDDFLNEITDSGGFLRVPFDMQFLTGESTRDIPVLSASLRRDTELIDGSMRASDYNNYYREMFKNVSTYSEQVALGELEDPAKEESRLELIEKSKMNAQVEFNKIQTDIKEKQFDGGHNGKHSYIRDNIMGVRMRDSATGVAVSDPRLDVDTVTMDSEMAKALDVTDGDHIMMWRDPVWREGAVSAQRVKIDDTVHGFGIHPSTMAPKDGDFDGDTLGAIKLNSKAANRELVEKLSYHSNLIDKGSSNEDSYIPTDQDYASARAEAELVGDERLEDLVIEMDKNARSNNPRLQKKAIHAFNEYNQIAMREMGYGSDYINLTNRETVEKSLAQMVERRTKGGPNSLISAMEYYDGKKTRKDAQSIQYAKGVQTDDTGLGGAVSQKGVSAGRNIDIQPILEVTYPVTQAILQIKHDDKQAIKINDFLRKEIPNLYNGKSSDGKTENMTKSQWVKDYYDILTNEDKLDVDVSLELVEKVADIMVGKNGNVVRNIDEVIRQDASPMDQIAYGGGWDRTFELAKSGEHSLLDGEMNKHFAPISMRKYDPDSELVVSRSDVRDNKFEAEMIQENERIGKLFTDDHQRWSESSNVQNLGLDADDIINMIGDGVTDALQPDTDQTVAIESTHTETVDHHTSVEPITLDLDDGFEP